MRVLAIVHQRDAGPGVFADVMHAKGVELDSWLRAEEAEPPRDPGDYDAVLTFGGAMHADQEDRHPWLREEKELLKDLIQREVPLLGVCLGAQLVAEAAGAPARRARGPEIGWFDVELTPEGREDPLLAPLAPGFNAFQWHSYEFPLPPDATPLAHSVVCLQAFRLNDSAWGIQFHAEATADIAEDWISDYRSDQDAVRINLEVEELRERTGAAIGSWNELGRGICERFLAVAATRTSASAQ